jgi:hypothetical protein
VFGFDRPPPRTPNTPPIIRPRSRTARLLARQIRGVARSEPRPSADGLVVRGSGSEESRCIVRNPRVGGSADEAPAHEPVDGSVGLGTLGDDSS